MVKWTLYRVESQTNEQANLDCLPGQEARRIIMKDVDTGAFSVVTGCYSITDTDPCTMLNALEVAGYTPNDWFATCATEPLADEPETSSEAA
jgi:hypothetical protein